MKKFISIILFLMASSLVCEAPGTSFSLWTPNNPGRDRLMPWRPDDLNYSTDDHVFYGDSIDPTDPKTFNQQFQRIIIDDTNMNIQEIRRRCDELTHLDHNSEDDLFYNPMRLPYHPNWYVRSVGFISGLIATNYLVDLLYKKYSISLNRRTRLLRALYTILGAAATALVIEEMYRSL